MALYGTFGACIDFLLCQDVFKMGNNVWEQMNSQNWLMGNNYLLQNNFKMALDTYKNMPRNSKIYFNIGILHIKRKSYRKATVALQKSLEMERSAIAYFVMACVLLKMQELDKAMNYFVYCLEVIKGEAVDYTSQGLNFVLSRKMVEGGILPKKFELFFPVDVNIKSNSSKSSMSSFKSERELWQRFNNKQGPMPAFI